MSSPCVTTSTNAPLPRSAPSESAIGPRSNRPSIEALAIMKYYQERNARILALAPKRLRGNWMFYAADNDERNVLADDRLSFTVLNHTDLSR